MDAKKNLDCLIKTARAMRLPMTTEHRGRLTVNINEMATELRASLAAKDQRINDLKCERDEYADMAVRTEIAEEKLAEAQKDAKEWLETARTLTAANVKLENELKAIKEATS